MVLPGEAAATAAAMVEWHPPLPPGFTQFDEANAGWHMEATRATARSCRGTKLGCFQE